MNDIEKQFQQQKVHDIALAYTLYTHLCDKPDDAESFIQDYNNAVANMKNLIEKEL